MNLDEAAHPLRLFRYCPVCGSPRFERHDFKSKRCAQCGFTYYHNASAATVAVVIDARYLFSLPYVYPYAGFEVHTTDAFFLFRGSGQAVRAADDVASLRWIPLAEVRPGQFGLASVRRGVERVLQWAAAGRI